MSKMLVSLIAVAGLTFSASPAFAKGVCTPAMAKWFGCTVPTPHAVPELSAAAAPVSIALVSGLLAFGLERRRRKQAKK